MMPFLVRRLEPLGDLAADVEGFVDGKRPARESLRQRLAFDELQDQEALALGLFQAVDRGDVRVIERCQQLRFALEPGEPLGIRREGFGQHFDGHLAVEPKVLGTVDFAHPARTELLDDLVM